MRREYPRFSARQLEIARLLADGKQPREIAPEIHLAYETVRNHCKWLRMRTNRHTITGAIAVLIREGWIE